MLNRWNGMRRRDFLRVAGATAATGAVALGPRRLRAQASGKIRVQIVGDPFAFSLKAFTDDFTNETGIEVELEELSYDQLQSRLISSFISGTGDADVITVDQMWTGQYLDNGWITKLDDFAAGDADFDLREFIPEVIYSLNTWRGKLVSLPIAAYAQGVIYRPDVFQALNIEEPPQVGDDLSDWTWDNYLETVGRLHGQEVGGTKMFGTVIVGAQPVPIVHMYSQVAASNGARWFTQFPEAPWDFEPLIDSQANISSAEMYRDLFNMSPPESINYVWFDAGTRFSQGDIGMFFWWTPYYYLVRNSGYMTGTPSVVRDIYKTAPLPAPASGDQTVSLGGWSLGIPSASDNQDAAWQFLKWATSAAVQKRMGQHAEFGFQFSDFSRQSLYEDADLRELYPYLDQQLAMMRLGNGKIARPPVPVYSTLEGIYGLQLNKILAGQQDIADGLAETNTLFKNVLTGNFLLPYQQESFNDTLDATKELIDKLSG